MPDLNWIEIIGYIGSLLVTISLMMKSIIKLRWINLAGALFFTIYGFVINAYPVFFLNAIISIADLYYIFKMYSETDSFEIFELESSNTLFLKRFMDYYRDDINHFFPSRDILDNEKPFIFFVLRNMLPVGLFIGDLKEDNILEIKVDFVIPGYRDFKIAGYVYHKRSTFFLEKNIHKLQIKSAIPKYDKFLKKMGFVRDEILGNGWFTYSFK